MGTNTRINKSCLANSATSICLGVMVAASLNHIGNSSHCIIMATNICNMFVPRRSFGFQKALWRRAKLQRTAKHDPISSWLCLITRAVNVDKAKRKNHMFADLLRNSEQTLEHNKDATKNIMQNLQKTRNQLAQQLKQIKRPLFRTGQTKTLANPAHLNRMAWDKIIRHEPFKRKQNVNQCSYPE